ncbi:MAG: hypothetical protein ACREOC_12580 [Gemmatimonadales bacterium]
MASRTLGREARSRLKTVLPDEELVDRIEVPELGEVGEALAPSLVPGPLPTLLGASGLYQYSRLWPFPAPIPLPPLPTAPVPGDGSATPEAAAPLPIDSRIILRETLRVDVDGRFPQMAVSGTIYEFLTERTHWVARVAANPDRTYAGPIWYLDGDVSNFPYDAVSIQVIRSFFPHQRRAVVTFSGPGGATRVRTYRFSSRYFRPCEFEYDTVEGSLATTSIATADHPNRPSTLPSETLTIERVFQRVGFSATKSSGDNVIPLVKAGTNERWSDSEMHDAMQVYWQRFADKAQWSLWTLFAALHDSGTSLGGIMFDDIGPNHRQGTAVFNESFIDQAPPGETHPDAWRQRMKFWTAVHEIGHTFNLAHSWQKVHPPEWGTPWTPLTNEPEARSFMNYPYFVAGGQDAFFASFEYRFSDQELLFMRHAPERFVQQGNAAWFDHHGFEQTRRSRTPPFRLEIRANRDKAVFEFLEPVVLELKLTNISGDPRIIDERLLATADRMTIAIKREGRPARRYNPFAQYCWHTRPKLLAPAEAAYESLFVGAGRNGWDVAEPGRYVIQAALHLDDEDIVSAPFTLKITPPRGYEEEELAQDLLTDDVGRVLAFDGTRALGSANDTLERAAQELGERRVAIHARIALACPLARNFKELQVKENQPRTAALTFTGRGANLDRALQEVRDVLGGEQPTVAAESLGNIDYADYAIDLARSLVTDGDDAAAKTVAGAMMTTLTQRKVPEPILQTLVERLPAEARSKAREGSRNGGATARSSGESRSHHGTGKNRK